MKLRDQYMLFSDGFRAGASRRPIDPEKGKVEPYQHGYSEGLASYASAVNAFAKHIGYGTVVLRIGKLEP